MRRTAALLILLAAGCAEPPPADPDAGFVPLFNGTDLSGWVRVNCAPETFRVEDGMIITTGKPTGVMRTERMYENYVAEFDWMHMKPKGNSGFFIHSGAVPSKGVPFTKGHEIQVLDGDSPDGSWTGRGDVFSIHGATFEPDRPHPKGWMRCLPSEKRANPAGQWNHYKVTVNDGTVKLEVNGKEVSGGTKCNPRKGYICLESEGSECRFKNLRVKELPSTKPPPAEVAEAAGGFESIYTGLDLRGWRAQEGLMPEWQPKDWILLSSSKGDPLSTEKEYGNYELIFDWRAKEKGTAMWYLGAEKRKLTAQSDKPGQWHRAHITVKEGRQTVIVDNWQAPFDQMAPTRPRSPITISGTPGDRIEFANLFVKELN